MTGKGLTIFAAALVMLTGCQMQTTVAGGETEAAMCDAWQDSLPTRSRADTPETIAQIGRAYDVFEAVCRRAVR
ncbi:hypothetical protein [uncultured Roseovarius sp.]|uniref:hypothetical protein n=1 Tax=uncultured Roseovarius sp. TaxID=293344 RepID=UPI000C424502|nr:hypothetical protein [Roseovarius sp.]MBD11553.1 hypothetical protein [Roseovarius sp.]|tara:strand:- start:1016 stop:1237 length:222 start_codon:yes stop_codon:yes gene_type:complete